MLGAGMREARVVFSDRNIGAVLVSQSPSLDGTHRQHPWNGTNSSYEGEVSWLLCARRLGRAIRELRAAKGPWVSLLGGTREQLSFLSF